MRLLGGPGSATRRSTSRCEPSRSTVSLSLKSSVTAATLLPAIPNFVGFHAPCEQAAEISAWWRCSGRGIAGGSL